MTRVTVFCGWRQPAGRQVGFTVGQALGKAGFEIAYGGGNSGTMAGIASGAQAMGARVTAVSLPQWTEGSDPYTSQHIVDELRVVPTMTERSRMLAELGDGYLVMSGGRGTLRELFDVWDAKAAGEHNKPIVILDPIGTFETLLSLLRELIAAGHVAATELDLVTLTPDHRTAIAYLQRTAR